MGRQGWECSKVEIFWQANRSHPFEWDWQPNLREPVQKSPVDEELVGESPWGKVRKGKLALHCVRYRAFESGRWRARTRVNTLLSGSVLKWKIPLIQRATTAELETLIPSNYSLEYIDVVSLFTNIPKFNLILGLILEAFSSKWKYLYN